MPKVGDQDFPYTKEGQLAAYRAAAKSGKSVEHRQMSDEERNQPSTDYFTEQRESQQRGRQRRIDESLRTQRIDHPYSDGNY